MLLAPRLNQALRDQLKCLICPSSEREPEIHGVTGLPFTTWVVETDVWPGVANPFSRS